MQPKDQRQRSGSIIVIYLNLVVNLLLLFLSTRIQSLIMYVLCSITMEWSPPAEAVACVRSTTTKMRDLLVHTDQGNTVSFVLY